MFDITLISRFFPQALTAAILIGMFAGTGTFFSWQTASIRAKILVQDRIGKIVFAIGMLLIILSLVTAGFNFDATTTRVLFGFGALISQIGFWVALPEHGRFGANGWLNHRTRWMWTIIYVICFAWVAFLADFSISLNLRLLVTMAVPALLGMWCFNLIIFNLFRTQFSSLLDEDKGGRLLMKYSALPAILAVLANFNTFMMTMFLVQAAFTFTFGHLMQMDNPTTDKWLRRPLLIPYTIGFIASFVLARYALFLLLLNS